MYLDINTSKNRFWYDEICKKEREREREHEREMKTNTKYENVVAILKRQIY